MRELPGAERMAIFTRANATISYLKDQEIELKRTRTDAEFWHIYTFEFIEGSPYPATDVENGNFFAVINEATKERFFGLEPVLGKDLIAGGQRFRIIGVVKNVPSFRNESFADTLCAYYNGTIRRVSYGTTGELLGNRPGKKCIFLSAN